MWENVGKCRLWEGGMQPLEDKAMIGGVDLWCSGLFRGRFGVNGHDPRGFELGQVQSELVLHPSEGGGCQTVTTDMFRTDRRKLGDPGFGHWFRTSRATGRGRKEVFALADAFNAKKQIFFQIKALFANFHHTLPLNKMLYQWCKNKTLPSMLVNLYA